MILKLTFIKNFLSFVCVSAALSCVSEEKSSWRNLEKISAKEKAELLKAVPKELDYLKDGFDWEEDYANNFVFLDLDNDEDLDLIFEGWSGGEPECVRIFLNKNDTYQKVFDEYQTVLELKMSDHGLNYLSTHDPGCCAAYVEFYKSFEVVSSSDSLRFKQIDQKQKITGTHDPNEIFETPISFEVQNENYFLRASPKIDTVNWEFEFGETESNILAKYPKGNKGKALGSSVDKTGRIWWYVEIDTSSKPLESHFYETVYFPSIICGWMSSRYLKEI